MNAPAKSRSQDDTEPGPRLVILASLISALVVALFFWEALPLFLNLQPNSILAIGSGLITLIAVLMLGFDRYLKRVAQLVVDEVELRD